MTARDLPRVERPVCAGCRAMVPEVEVPRGDGAIRCCWVCAHAIVDHDCDPEDALDHTCSCGPEVIYPDDVLRLRASRSASLVEPATPAAPRVHTLVSRCYGLDGKPDEHGPRLVQTFEEVRPGVVQLTSTTVREQTRGERMAKKQHERSARARQAAMPDNFGKPRT